MSRSPAIIRFKKTGNIYYGCHDNCSSTMLPILYNTKISTIYPGLDYFSEEEIKRQSDIDNIDEMSINDLDEIEIYVIDYDSWHKSKGSEKLGIIIDCSYHTGFHGKPEWVKGF